MTDTKNPGDKTLHVSSTKTLTLKRPETGTVRQSFSHGRTKSVVVEKVKRHTSPPPAAPRPVEVKEAPKPAPAPVQPAPAAAARPAQTAPSPAPSRPAPVKPSTPGGLVLRPLSNDELEARQSVLEDSRKREEETRRQAETEAKARAERDAREAAERAASEARKREEDDRRRHEDDLKRKAADEARRRLGEPAPRAPSADGRPERAASGAGGYSVGTGGRRPQQLNFDRPRPEGRADERADAGSPPERSARPYGDRPQGDRPSRPYGDRPQGDRPPRPYGDRPQGDRPPRPYGDRPQGDRPPRPYGDRPQGDRPPRPYGDRPQGDRPPRPYGDRPQGDRPPRPFGDRGPRPPGGPRPFGGGGFNPGPAPGDNPMEGARPQRSRGDGMLRPARRPTTPIKPAADAKPAKGGDANRRGRLTLSNALEDESEKSHSTAAFRRRVQRLTGHRDESSSEKISREVTVPETITIQELANRMTERAVDVIRLLMKQGQMLKINDVIDADTAQLIAEEMGHTVRRVAESDVEEGLFESAVEDTAEEMMPRPPVVTIMGHVDHGKTSLLDAIRHANVVSGEAGGITQHIGAYQVTAPSGGKITFIDTPGHAAFSAMRARGAKVTDIVVLVVAADDGVMPQTVEAINHAKAAKVPVIVAINKIDKPDAKPERVRTELLQYEVQVEAMGGEVQDVEVSAKNKTNLDGLLEAIALQAELLDLKANANRPGEGTVIEAKLDRGRGPVTTVLVQRGTLVVGDIVVAGSEWGKVRALIADTGESVKFAGPSFPVEVLGFSGTPDAGDRVAVVDNEARAREITAYRERQKRDKAVARQATMRGSLAEMMKGVKDSAGKKEFPLIVKADVQGSVEAIVSALEKLGNDEVRARVIHSGVGGITESDITLAESSAAAVIGFNVRAHKEAREAAERTGTEIRYYNIIYNLVDDVKDAMSGLLAPTLREERLGEAQIKEIFAVSKVGKVAGCVVSDGVVQRGANVRLIRDNVVIHEGKLSTLQRFKDQVAEVRAGQECGMSFENYQDMRAGDVIECYKVEEVKRTL
ncbi:translation initiation factor IF-2 [Terrarubrum flagellatum]|uniref:translation initiation factor IF-2 n=1 Tax=Terrirubrum flagellatum TaxID=2895980 RepID=UPI003145225D